MDAGVVHHDESPFVLVTAARQHIEKLHIVAAAGAPLVQVVVQLFYAPVQSFEDVHTPVTDAGIHAMGQAQGDQPQTLAQNQTEQAFDAQAELDGSVGEGLLT